VHAETDHVDNVHAETDYVDNVYDKIIFIIMKLIILMM
jgi:hypothetical protein